jgi:hypothetical protein
VIEPVFNRFIAWKLRNKYDKDGKMIEPRPKEDDVHEERFLAWVSGRRTCVSCRETDQAGRLAGRLGLPEGRQDGLSVGPTSDI